jgi:NADPH-dependent 2,4-dienoyl-CoA reductase/sulfur reductase-like enzyme
MAFPPAAFLYLPSAVKQACDVAVFHAGRIADLATANRAVDEGHVDMIAMTRAHLADPHIMKKLAEGRVDDIRQCVGANYCIDRIYVGGDALCIQNPSTGREASLPHVLPRAPARRRIVVAGGGVAGMEAARAAAERGHDVVLYEQAERLGGQVNLAARAGWRENLSGITRWLAQQVEKMGIDVRLGKAATPEAIVADRPDMVVVATGGRPNKGRFEGDDLAVSSWDVLTGAVEPGENVLLHDDNGQHQGVSVAQFLAQRGAQVELATPDRMVAEEMGSTNFSVHLSEMYRHGIVMSPNLRLVGVRRQGNKLVARLRNEFSREEEERLIDQVVAEHGTLPVDDLYFALKPQSSNLGEVDLDALIAGHPQAIVNNPDGGLQLFRIGDCVAGRNIHAALYDARRLMRDV